ncbi:coagulation factor VIIi [Danio aesculapii]|uniref:coagulation factor VIIi n=1 Tax=Danio aesculapii TaxID=1142201 RepID=UPI0024C0AAFA|nr:coagulation factor VIIi [Danio aesculapii]
MRVGAAAVLLCVLTVRSTSAVFLSKDEATAVLQRFRRANSGFLEEMKAGNLERECVEEICDYEEAREVFEDDDRTKQFWLSYSNKEPCLTNPCRNNGTCIYLADSYYCLCAEGFEGKYCEKGLEETLKCQYVNGGCEQFCDGSGARRSCSCAEGYTLADDGTSCVSQAEYPCGKIPLQKNTSQNQFLGGIHCPRGHCPWQVLIDYNGEGVCGGALLEGPWLITAAHCVYQKDTRLLKAITGEHDLDVLDGSEEAYEVSAVFIHPNYDPESLDSDLALLRLRVPVQRSTYAVPICLPTPQLAHSELWAARFHMLSGWGARTAGHNIRREKGLKGPASGTLQRLAVPLLPTAQCGTANTTANMFCAGYTKGDRASCRGHDGSPLVTRYGQTSFLTGVVSWGRGCGPPGYYWVYTKVENFLIWMDTVMKTHTEDKSEQSANVATKY